MRSSSRVFSAPPISARARDERTSRAPEKEGLPLSTIMALAALVSLRRRRTSYSLSEGVMARHCSFAASPLAWAASSSNTAGSSSVINDFSYRSIN